MRHPQQAGQDPLGDADGGTPHSRAPAATPLAYPEREGTHATNRVVQEGLTRPQLDRTRQGGRDARDESQAPAGRRWG